MSSKQSQQDSAIDSQLRATGLRTTPKDLAAKKRLNAKQSIEPESQFSITDPVANELQHRQCGLMTQI